MLRRMLTVSTGVLLAACGPAEDAADMPGSAAETARTPETSEPGAQAPAAAATESAGLTPTPAPPDASVYFIEPADGATVQSPVRVVFGLSGAGVAPAGVEHDAAGHHHLLVDAPMPPAGRPIPSDDSHRHFGGGQTEAEISLSPGSHTLQLVLADHLHVPHDPPIASERITITVE